MMIEKVMRRAGPSSPGLLKTLFDLAAIKVQCWQENFYFN
jgi:hypothetical protein